MIATAQPAANGVQIGLATSGENAHYRGNRAPLKPAPLIKLPIGAVRPEGWLRQQLLYMADGFSGRLPELSRFTKFEGNAWTDKTGAGQSGWEEVPYWLKGYVNLGYVLDDKRIEQESLKWLEAVFSSLQPNGYFGPRSNLDFQMYQADFRALDLWPNMVMLYPLRTYYEKSGDKRVLDLMLKHFKWQSTLPLNVFLPASWQKWRAGDNLEIIYWLYNQTGETWLLDHARVNHERTADWVGSIPTWHGVNLSQCFVEPALYYQQTGDKRYLDATQRVYDTFMNLYGQVPGGMFGADENARPGFNDPRQGAETCSMVEIMYSHERLAAVTGDSIWADRAEEVAFNSLPASVTPDHKGLHYVTAPNQIQLDRRNKAPMIENAGDMMSYNPYQYRCCQHNYAFGWPYYAERAWMATFDNGLAAMFYAPAQVRAKVGSGSLATIEETTDYPFDDVIRFKISLPKPERFPFALRIPAWTESPTLTVNGAPVNITNSKPGWVRVMREWKQGDVVELRLPMRVTVRRWAHNHDSASVDRGPLTYSLKIGERWQRYGDDNRWPAFEVFPSSAWNYGLVLDDASPATSFEFVRKPGPIAAQPFTPDAAPVMLRAKAKRIAEWQQEPNGMAGQIQKSPVRSDAPVETVELIPMGAARLRISSFPVIANNSAGHTWAEAVPIITASHANHFESPHVVNDGIVRTSSLDSGAIGYFSWRGRSGSREWIEYRYSTPQKFSWSDVYWYDDSANRGPHRLPAGWRLLWWDGKAWQPVQSRAPIESTEDRVDHLMFHPVMTTAVRIEVDLARGYTAGIMEWRVGE